MKTTKNDFEIFKKWCLYYQKLYHLESWQIFFLHESLIDRFAEIGTNIQGRTASITFAKEWDGDLWDEPQKKTKVTIKKIAKHEIIHLFLAKSRNLSLDRFSTEEEILEADHELVNLLDALLPN